LLSAYYFHLGIITVMLFELVCRMTSHGIVTAQQISIANDQVPVTVESPEGRRRITRTSINILFRGSWMCDASRGSVTASVPTAYSFPAGRRVFMGTLAEAGLHAGCERNSVLTVLLAEAVGGGQCLGPLLVGAVPDQADLLALFFEMRGMNSQQANRIALPVGAKELADRSKYFGIDRSGCSKV